MDGPAAELEAAERVVMRWDSSSASPADEPMLFDGGGDRAKADRFLRAVDDLRRLAPASPAAVGSPRRLLSSGSSAAPRLDLERLLQHQKKRERDSGAGLPGTSTYR